MEKIKSGIPVTKHTVVKEDLPYLVRKKFFVVRPRILSSTLQYVPCWKIILGFSISYFKKNHGERGKVEFIVDDIKGCGVVEDRTDFKMESKSLKEGLILAASQTENQAEKKAIVDARWKVLMARYKKPAELETDSIKAFYRPYYLVEYTYGKKLRKEWVPADDFGNYFVYN